MKTDQFLGPLKSSKKSYDLELASVSKEIHAEAKFENANMKLPFLKCRHVVTFIGFLCFFSSNNVRVNMSINIVAMVNQSAVAQRTNVESDSCPLLVSNSTETENAKYEYEDGEFLWSPQVQGYILGSYFVGYITTQIPTGRLADTYGCKWFIFASSLVTALTTFLMPAFAWMSAEALIVLQLIRGLTQGLLQPAVSVLVSNWFTTSERGQMLAIMQSGTAIGSIVASLLSGFLCASSAKWPSSFYASGAIGVVVSILVIFFVHECPRVHPRITKAELNFILKNQEAKIMKKKPSPPWRKMFTSVPVYALFYSNFGQDVAYFQFMLVHTIFLGTILHYPIAKNAMITSLTFLLQFVCTHLATCFSSLMIKKNIASITFTRKLMNFVSCFGFSACMLGIYLSRCNRSLSAVFGILSAGFTGIGNAGSLVTVPEMAPTFAGVLQGFNVTVACSSAVILPLIVGYLTNEKQTIEQWNKEFFTAIGVVMSSGIFYSIFGSADVQPWNFVQEESNEEITDSKTRF